MSIQENQPAPEKEPAEVLRKRIYIGFAAIMALGVAIVGGYIGERLYATPTPQQATVKMAAKVLPPAAVPTTPAAPASTPAAAPSTPAGGGPVTAMIDPKPGERYLQLAALGLKATRRYMPELKAQGLHPLVAQGPDESTFRVLLGPFADRPELKRQQHTLETAGMVSFEREY